MNNTAHNMATLTATMDQLHGYDGHGGQQLQPYFAIVFKAAQRQRLHRDSAHMSSIMRGTRYE